MKSHEAKEFIKEVFKNTLENKASTEETFEKYFSKDYVQYVDGKTLRYDDFISHVKWQKKVIESFKVSFKYIIAEEDTVSTIHIVDAVKKDGSFVQAQVNAVFKIKDKKIILCDELTHLIAGEKSDSDLGSRH